MWMTMEIEIGEIHDRFVGAPGGDFTHPHESSEALNDFRIYQVGRNGVRPRRERYALRLGRQLRSAGETPTAPTRQRRSRRLAFLTDHCSGSCLQRHTLSTVEPGQHVIARGTGRQTLEFGQEVVGQCPP